MTWPGKYEKDYRLLEAYSCLKKNPDCPYCKEYVWWKNATDKERTQHLLNTIRDKGGI